MSDKKDSADDEKEFNEIVEWLGEDILTLRCRLIMSIFYLHNHDATFWKVVYPDFVKSILQINITI